MNIRYMRLVHSMSKCRRTPGFVPTFWQHFVNLPEVRGFFPRGFARSNHRQLADGFLAGLAAAIRFGHDDGSAAERLRGIARSHRELGVEARHCYYWVTAVIQAVRSVEGPDWPAVRSDWDRQLTRVAEFMVSQLWRGAA